ncbi:MAG TPA: efflux RND transporter permease subunit [Pirellulales bacterium]|jgi:multidrug efflux pump subunit AcrB|nr:efflux RND transporter permease subunit [Pirellulales bacterium]
MIAQFFVDRPIFATVISVVFVLAGGVAVFTLPVAQYPDVAPPTVSVTALYPGANSETVRKTVAAPIEEQISGVEGMMYMSSQSTNDGAYHLTVTFKLGTDSDMAQVLVQNRVSLALPVIPPLVQNEGINVRKTSPNTLMIVNLISPDKSHDAIYLSNYATIYVRDELGRLPGVAGITYLGQRDYSLRAWLNPDKLAAMQISAMDVVNAIGQQNIQVAAGQIGQQPVPLGQQFQLPINTLGRLTDPEQFGDIIIKAGQSSLVGTIANTAVTGGTAATTSSSGAAPSNPGTIGPGQNSVGIVRLRDVGRVELGSQQYDQSCTLDGSPSVALSIYQLPGSNALETSDHVYEKMKELKARFPDGVDYQIVYDTTPFIRESVNEVFYTLRDAVILVAIVVLIFLQDWRAMILPMIDVPVSLIGTFAVMAAMGFTLNNLTLFGLVLAIGIVVDDAIVVLENIERLIATGLDARTATIKAMEEITGPILAITLVLSSVFLPCCFLGGISGQFFRQFAVTISVSTIISAINAITMTPSRAVVIFKTEEGAGHAHQREALPWWIFGILGGLMTVWIGHHLLAGHYGLPAFGTEDHLDVPRWMPWAYDAAYFLPGMVAGAVFGWFVIGVVNGVLGRFFRWFNRQFDWLTELYGRGVSKFLRMSFMVLLVYGGLLALTYWQFSRAPTGFVPQQDKGYLIVNVQLQDSASVARTERLMARIENVARKTPGVKHTVGISGQSLILGANASNLGSMYVLLDDFDKRRGSDLSGPAIAAQIQANCRREVRGAIISVFGAPPIDGLGTTGGFKMVIEDRGNLGADALQQNSEKIIARAAKTAGLQGLFNSSSANTPWLYLDIDRTKCMALGLQISDIFSTLQVYLGSFYVNNFNEFGRTWQVNVQADARFRDQEPDIRQLQVRNSQGQMVRLGTMLDVRYVSGPAMVMRYNLYSTAAINGDASPGTSSGEAVALMQEIAQQELPHSMVAEWTDLALLQLQAGNTAMYSFILAVMFVFLVLAAQYESWSLPLAVILVVPMCLFCSVIGVTIANLDVNIFTQIGFIVLVGLASKNAILIVEFAKQQHEAGKSRWDATLEACRLRLRPILMTSFAFILGVVPLMLATGAGAEMRQTLGVAVFSGMLGVTAFGIFLTPVFFYVIQWFKDRHRHETGTLAHGAEQGLLELPPDDPAGGELLVPEA